MTQPSGPGHRAEKLIRSPGMGQILDRNQGAAAPGFAPVSKARAGQA